jgi:hypothetical protein
VVVRELWAQAERDVIVSTFVIQGIETVFEPLAARMADRPDAGEAAEGAGGFVGEDHWVFGGAKAHALRGQRARALRGRNDDATQGFSV